MNDTVDLGVLGEDIVESALVGDVELVKGRAASTDSLNSVEDVFERVVQAVDDDDVVAVLEESKGSERANVASATAVGGVSIGLGVLSICSRAMAYPVTRTVPTAILRGYRLREIEKWTKEGIGEVAKMFC